MSRRTRRIVRRSVDLGNDARKEVRPALDTAGSDARIPATDSDRRRAEGIGEHTSMRISMHLVLVGAMALLGLVAGAGPATAQDKDTLVIALDTLGAMVMDPIADTRAPHAHYHAPIWDSLVGFDLDKGGIGPGVAE